MSDRPVVIVSNRGPVSYSFDAAGALVARRGSGGIVSGLAPLAETTHFTWIAAALSEADRAAAARGRAETDGMDVLLLDIEEQQLRMAYDLVCNATLWFLHHELFDLARRPVFDRRWHEAWSAYRATNLQFAEAVGTTAPDGSIVLVQDYHLCLLAELLGARRPDLSFVHFSHTPFAGPDAIRVLPEAERHELLRGLCAHGATGFHTRRWARSYETASIQELGEAAHTFVAPLAPEVESLRQSAHSSECEAEHVQLNEQLGDRRLVVRSDRIELSKNLLRGFGAFDLLLEREPSWRGEVVFGAFCYPSREGLPEYLAYRQQVEDAAAEINDRWRRCDGPTSCS
jgi:trehalose 6-phosphate synthase